MLIWTSHTTDVPEVLEWLNEHFTAHQIGSWATYSLEVTAEDESDKGSLKERYFTVARGRSAGPPPGDEVPQSDKDTLFSLHQRSLYKGMGTNAAGIVITSNEEEFNKLVPLAYMASCWYQVRLHHPVLQGTT
jgi:hypothetical protein